MESNPFLKSKSPEELKKQVKTAEKVLGRGLIPPEVSITKELDISFIKEKYKTRYDAYVAALRAQHGGGLSEALELKYVKEWITGLNNLDVYIKEHESQDNPVLREKQYIVYKKIRDFLEKGGRKGYIKLPTGTGKTILFLKIAEALGMKTLVVSPSIIIREQNTEETREFTDAKFSQYGPRKEDLSGQVTHITYQSLVSAVKSGKISPNEFPILILDETHRSLGTERMKVVKQFSGLQLGFTATSEFSEDKTVAGLLEEEIFRMDVAEAIREGLICNTQNIHAYTKVDLSSVSIEKGQYNKAELEKVVNVHGRNLAAVELYRNKFSQLKVLCNCSGVAHANEVARLFNEKGFPAACITGDTSEEERVRILKNYKEGKIKVLTNARVLLEGFNEPSCSVTFNLHPTLSLIDAEQRARSGRLDKNNPDKWSYVVDFIDQNSRRPEVLYSEILQADRVWDISKEEYLGSSKKQDRRKQISRPPISFDGFKMEGLRVEIKDEKIMEVTNRNSLLRKEEKEEWSFTDLQIDVGVKGIKTSAEYQLSASKNRWPSSWKLTAMAEFPKKMDGSNDWDTFFGKEKRKEWTFASLQADVKAKGVKSSKDYHKKAPENQWPSYKILNHMSGFPKNSDGSKDWATFLGKEKFNFKKLKAEILAKGVSSSQGYNKHAPRNKWPAMPKLVSQPEFPKNPDGSNDWQTFFGKRDKPWEKRKEWTFATLQADVRDKGIKSSVEYMRNAPKNKWPSPTILIAKTEFPKKPDGSNDWDIFLGRKNKK